MMELYIERKNGELETQVISLSGNDLLTSLIKDDDVVSFQIVKETNTSDNFNGQKKCPIKYRLSSVRRKNVIEDKKREAEEKNISRRYRREKLLKKNESLPEIISTPLSVCSLNAQMVYWTIREAEKDINRKKICEVYPLATRTINNVIKELTDHCLIKRIGSKKTGYYQVCDDLYSHK